MKTTNTINGTLFSLLLLGLLTFGQTALQANAIRQDNATTYIKIWVDGMACPFCAYGLEKRIKKLKGAKELYVDINEGFITFVVPADKKPSQEELEKAVKEAGFTARQIEYADTPFETETEE